MAASRCKTPGPYKEHYKELVTLCMNAPCLRVRIPIANVVHTLGLLADLSAGSATIWPKSVTATRRESTTVLEHVTNRGSHLHNADLE